MLIKIRPPYLTPDPAKLYILLLDPRVLTSHIHILSSRGRGGDEERERGEHKVHRKLGCVLVFESRR